MPVAAESQYRPHRRHWLEDASHPRAHNPPVILRKSDAGCEVFRLETGGPVIGLLRECYQQESFALEQGDLIVLFTDGISESMNARDEEWGEDRFSSRGSDGAGEFRLGL